MKKCIDLIKFYSKNLSQLQWFFILWVFGAASFMAILLPIKFLMSYLR
jgi:hypothetical protein